MIFSRLPSILRFYNYTIIQFYDFYDLMILRFLDLLIYIFFSLKKKFYFIFESLRIIFISWDALLPTLESQLKKIIKSKRSFIVDNFFVKKIKWNLKFRNFTKWKRKKVEIDTIQENNLKKRYWIASYSLTHNSRNVIYKIWYEKIYAIFLYVHNIYTTKKKIKMASKL